MDHENRVNFIKNVLEHMPTEWLKLTTHRLDIYNENFAKTEFLEQFEKLLSVNTLDKNILKKELSELPTAFDYIRLGHPLSCILEWVTAKSKKTNAENVISFSSKTMPIFSILRRNLLENINTQIIFKDELPKYFDVETVKRVYGYKFELKKINSFEEIEKFNGSTILLSNVDEDLKLELGCDPDFIISMYADLGSVVLVYGKNSESYISEIQHVRRRESIAMTPNDCFTLLNNMFEKTGTKNEIQSSKAHTLNTIKEITNSFGDASVGSSGLSVQYAIMMGLIHYSLDKYKGKDIKLIVPPNCYGGTNDQARRAAACIKNVEILDLAVDGGTDMVDSVEDVLEQVAKLDAVPFIIAEIPTNPRVEVPDLEKLSQALNKKRKTNDNRDSIPPVFILDQTFCPNVKFLGDADILSTVKTISYVSGSKFPSGGMVTAGYCVANKKAEDLMSYIDNHLKICDNEATDFQTNILSKQMPSMIERINEAYQNTRKFVDFINETLPEAKINFVSKELADAGFTPSVFSLDLPTKGDTHEAREFYKRDLNLKLINLMINEIPYESKHCVSYGQLKGCYWTIPATSTQGTTKEGDKDYIVRVAISPDFDLDRHKKVFTLFCNEHIKKNN